MAPGFRGEPVTVTREVHAEYEPMWENWVLVINGGGGGEMKGEGSGRREKGRGEEGEPASGPLGWNATSAPSTHVTWAPCFNLTRDQIPVCEVGTGMSPMKPIERNSCTKIPSVPGCGKAQKLPCGRTHSCVGWDFSGLPKNLAEAIKLRIRGDENPAFMRCVALPVLFDGMARTVTAITHLQPEWDWEMGLVPERCDLVGSLAVQVILLWPIQSQEGAPVKLLRDRGAHREQGVTRAAVWNIGQGCCGPRIRQAEGLGNLAVSSWTWGPCVDVVTGTCFSPCEFRRWGLAGATPGQHEERGQWGHLPSPRSMGKPGRRDS